MAAKVLLIEDSTDYHKVVARALPHLSVEFVTSAEGALEKLAQTRYDLILLDLQLPAKDGHTFLSELAQNSSHRQTPVICLTGKTAITDKVTAFTLGADDYIIKPFDPIEFRARIDSKIARRSLTVDRVTAGDLSVDVLGHRVLRTDEDGHDEEIAFTPIEFKIVQALISNKDRVLTRDRLIESAWGVNVSVSDRTIDVHACAIRKKLARSNCMLQAVPGVGYKLFAQVALKKIGA